MLHTVRSKIILLGVSALVLSLGISLPLELLEMQFNGKFPLLNTHGIQ